MNIFAILLMAMSLIRPAPSASVKSVTPKPETIVVVGDSVAHSMDSSVLIGAGRDGCGVTRYAPQKAISRDFPIACAANRDNYILNLPQADAYVIFSTWEINDFVVNGQDIYFGTPEWSEFLTSEYEVLLAYMPGPTYIATVPERGPVNGVVPNWNANDSQNTAIMNNWYRWYAATHDNVELLDVAEIVCPGNVCPEWVDGVKIRPDSGHYSTTSAEWIGVKIKDAIWNEWR